MKIREIINEYASAGATSTANIGTVVNPHISPGSARGKKSYTGSAKSGSGTKAHRSLKLYNLKTQTVQLKELTM